jgi:hypothetical protein
MGVKGTVTVWEGKEGEIMPYHFSVVSAAYARIPEKMPTEKMPTEEMPNGKNANRKKCQRKKCQTYTIILWHFYRPKNVNIFAEN